jgi:hypothetical protein
VLGEWFAYLNADPHCEQKFLWVVESFAEVELPSPWTSYKGVGSIVCYLNNETNETTWKHPFYDYFAQLLDHCRKASTEEHIKLRINRMLWTYEADCAADLATQQPLLSPKYIRNMGDILECDLRTEPFLVNTMKTFLKAFSQQYRLEEDIEIQEIKWCREIAENERQKAAISHDLALEDCDPSNDESKKIDPAVHAQIYCVDCGVLAVMFCTTCQDSLCEDCFGRLHSKGNRRNHEFNNIIPCSFCQVYPAKLQCTYTFGNFCHECYARKHVKTLPKFLDLKPLKIDYRMKSSGSVPIVQKSQGKYYDPHRDNPSSIVFRESTLDENWHSFYDLRGAMYYYNFQTNESMRRETERVIESDPMENRTLLNLSQDHRPRSLKFYSSPIKVVEKNETPRKHHHHGHDHGHDKTPGKDGGHAGHAAGTPSTAAPDSPVMQESP